MAKSQESSIAALEKRFDEAETKVKGLQEQLAEAQQERESAGEALRGSLATILDKIGADEDEEPAPKTRKKRKAGTYMSHKDRCAIHARRIKKGRGKPVPMIEVRKHYAEEVGKDVKVIAAQVKSDCEKSDLFKVKGKGRKMAVVMA